MGKTEGEKFMSKGNIFLRSGADKHRFENIVKISIIVLLLLILGAWFISYNYAEDVNAGLSQNLVRLHVVANSDSATDQALKLKVRDAIIELMKDKLANSSNINETRSIINDNIKEIESELDRRYYGSSLKALHVSLINANKKYLEAKKRL